MLYSLDEATIPTFSSGFFTHSNEPCKPSSRILDDNTDNKQRNTSIAQQSHCATLSTNPYRRSKSRGVSFSRSRDNRAANGCILRRFRELDDHVFLAVHRAECSAVSLRTHASDTRLNLVRKKEYASLVAPVQHRTQSRARRPTTTCAKSSIFNSRTNPVLRSVQHADPIASAHCSWPQHRHGILTRVSEENEMTGLFSLFSPAMLRFAGCDIAGSKP